MRKIRVLLASTLKPVNDTRMYEKLGRTLALLPELEVHICGYAAPFPAAAAVQFHPLFSFSRLSLGRLTAQQKFYRLLRQVRPQLLIVCTFELLPSAVLYQKQYGCRLVYDVQENYALNLRTQQVYPAGIGHFLAFFVKTFEKRFAQYISHFLLAEKSYAEELSFIGSRYTVLENKYQPVAPPAARALPVQLNPERLRLLYTGTISEPYGIFEAIAFAAALHALKPGTTLTIAGYCARQTVYERLLRELLDKPFISLIGGNQLVPHRQIVEQIGQADLGLVPYRPHPSTFRCMPTKIYEYAANALPMLVQENPYWQPFVNRHRAGLFTRFEQPDIRLLLQQLGTAAFYPAGAPAEALWQQEADKLTSLIRNMIS